MNSSRVNRQTTTVKIHDLNSAGEGVGRLPGGKVVFVPFSLPGEEVAVKIVAEKKRWCRGRVQEVMTPAENRRIPPCPVYRRCGGCSLQHLDYDHQLAWKREKVREAAVKIGKEENPEIRAALGSPRAYHYRNRVTLSWEQQGGRHRLGFYSPGSRQLIELKECLLIPPQGNAVLESLPAFLESSGAEGQGKERNQVTLRFSFSEEQLFLILHAPPHRRELLQELTLSLKGDFPFLEGAFFQPLPGDDRLHPAPLQNLWGRERLMEKLLEKPFHYSPASFFQVNPAQAETLYRLVQTRIAEGVRRGLLLDLHCGVGVMALLAADLFEQVVGLDSQEEAIEDARSNARGLQKNHASFFFGRAEYQLPLLLQEGADPEAVILNPPRRGCPESLLETIASHRIPLVLYVSCNPATLARDMRFLRGRGYRPGPVQPVDMFPQTPHMESFTYLEKTP